MSLATLDANGSPDVRMMLFKDVDEHGFVFYTNMQSPKARGLMRDPRVALCFYWAKIDKQVRVRGQAELVTDDEADAYFATRPRLIQISAWASKQSQTMRGYFEFEAAVARKRTTAMTARKRSSSRKTRCGQENNSSSGFLPICGVTQ